MKGFSKRASLFHWLVPFAFALMLSLILGACGQDSVERQIDRKVDYPNKLTAGRLSLEYPDSLTPISWEDSNGMFSSVTVGGAGVAVSHGVSSSDLEIRVTLSETDASSSVSFARVKQYLEKIAELVGTIDLGYKRTVAEIEHVKVNGTDALLAHTVLERVSATNGEGADSDNHHGLVCLLFEGDLLIGQVYGVFMSGSYYDDASLYENMLSTLSVDSV